MKIVRNRTIRPSSRNENIKSSNRYKIDTEKVTSSDMLCVNINHESLSFNETYYFKGDDVSAKNSIGFKVLTNNDKIQIIWSGAIPLSKS